jgi:hypothetical protein
MLTESHQCVKSTGEENPEQGMGKGDPFLLSKIHETIRREEGHKIGSPLVLKMSWCNQV